MWRQAFALLILGFALTAQASNSFDFSTENYRWSEYKSDGSWFLTESGQRYNLGLSATDYQGIDATYSTFRFYFGDVFYDGQLQDGTPYQSTTGYTGFLLEQRRQAFFSSSMTGYGEFSYGMDAWQRVLDKGGNLGYTENYLVLYLRAGLGVGRYDSGWHANIGLKYPLVVSEAVNQYPYDTTRLSPKPEFSAYGETGYADPASGWGLVFYYDAYNFEASDWAPVTYGGYYAGSARQPRSVMERVGARVSLYF